MCLKGCHTLRSLVFAAATEVTAEDNTGNSCMGFGCPELFCPLANTTIGGCEAVEPKDVEPVVLKSTVLASLPLRIIAVFGLDVDLGMT